MPFFIKSVPSLNCWLYTILSQLIPCSILLLVVSPIDETTEKHVFLPQKGPYLPNRPNRKRAWDSVTRRVWVYREKFNIDFWFQKFFLTSQHILGLPKKILDSFDGWLEGFISGYLCICVRRQFKEAKQIYKENNFRIRIS